MSVPEGLLYTKDHEWARIEGDTAVIGITDFAQDALGEVVFLELPEEGAALTVHGAFGVVESTKAASDLYAPVAGTVIAVNKPLIDDPGAVNADPYGKGWLIKVRITAKADDLLDAAAYGALLAAAG